MLKTIISKLGELLEFKNGKVAKLVDEGQYEVYGSNGIIGRTDKYNHENAIIIGRVGAYCGSVAYSTEPFWATDNTIVVYPKTYRDEMKYYYYLLKKMNLNHYAGGSAQPLLIQSVLKELEIKLLSERKHRLVTAITISHYDDLIENNRCRIQILEEMAKTIHREWFVHFRFPGYEEVQMGDSELGKIPDGWSVSSFTDMAEVLSGGTPKTKIPEYWNGEIPFFTPKDIESGYYLLDTERHITELGLNNCRSILYSKDTVFITARGTVGRVVLPAVPMAMSQSSYALKGLGNIGQIFVFFKTLECVEHLKKMTHGAVFDTIIIDTFKALQISLPPIDLIHKFCERVAPFLDLVLTLLKQNNVLQKTRDILLPKLVSGAIDISELNTDVPILLKHKTSICLDDQSTLESWLGDEEDD